MLSEKELRKLLDRALDQPIFTWKKQPNKSIFKRCFLERMDFLALYHEEFPDNMVSLAFGYAIERQCDEEWI